MTENQWSWLLAEGIKAAERGDREMARAHLLETVALRPDAEVAWLWLARLADSMLEKAEYIKRVMELTGNFGPLQQALFNELRKEGERLADAGERVSAHACFLEASTLDPTDESVWLKLAATASDQAETVRCLENVIALNPSNVEAALWLRRVRPPTREIVAPPEMFEMPDESNEPHFILERPSGPLRTALPATPPRGTVLLVEDDAEFRDHLAAELAEAGFRVIMAEDGMRAMRLLETVTPTAVVVNDALPMLDGLEICRLIRKHPALRNLPVVLLSEEDGFMDRIKAKMAGVSETLTKSAALLWLPESVAKYCRNSSVPGATEPYGNAFGMI